MLKVTVVDGTSETRVKVEGVLAGPSVVELESVWKQIRDARENGKVLIDLSETTAIDAGGKRILTVMACEGAELFAKGVYIEYVVKGLVQRAHDACQS